MVPAQLILKDNSLFIKDRRPPDISAGCVDRLVIFEFDRFLTG